ncbi:glycoside hydrolase family 9 protein [Actinoplanes derwentensis]|uniref:Endoglucanase n=1 Tax=Actinoplanes derwentensis TaxID=113562 RepID=A0A1H1R045_9ACTN|nr:glycoside hydrolase family 9 protein [Actinoplanes derwentensis]GID87118.1 endoglucanase [Actinoplanes derwentensis]SDS29158.1 Carbohydrate binding domain-containing protein [Actinoplanes derwentensis]
MHLWERSRLIAAISAAILLTAGAAAPAYADEVEQVVNGTFDSGTEPFWTNAGMTIGLADGRACVDVPGGTVNRWDAAVGQNDVDLVAGETYRFSFDASGDAGHVVRAITGLAVSPYDTYFEQSPILGGWQHYEWTFTANASTTQGQVAFQVGGSPDPWRFCVDNVSLVGGVPPEVYEPDTGPRVRVNQVAYLPDGPKGATVVTSYTSALPWILNDKTGRKLASGRTVPRGTDPSSGQNVHTIDFSGVHRAATGLTITADGETSRPFDIGRQAYQKLRSDALKLYYTQRSGIAIRDDLRPGYARPAGHVGVAPNQGDTAVPCQPGVCDYTLDVRGGWYDAGDHGKYVVNGGISVWELLAEYEHNRGSRKLNLSIPESGNRVPDILDEARWELEFLLSMQAPGGLVHHKIHDRAWTGLPLLPHLDPQPRELHPVSTAATLNLAATAAQAARLFKPYDAAFARRALAAARTAYDAARANPALYAPESDGVGGGAYNDAKVTDDFYWAAAELYLTTGERKYASDVLASPEHSADVFGPVAFDWASTAAAAKIDLALVPNRLPGLSTVKSQLVTGADKYLAIQREHPYGVAYAPANNSWDWGSSSIVANNLVVIAAAHRLTGRAKYRNGLITGLDWLFGRNALNISYVTGYGEVAAQNQHSRWYAAQLDPSLPHPPPGTLAGGPNSSIQDPVAQSLLQGCVGQFCYIDDIQSWSTNELTINWNAALAHLIGYAAELG